MTPKLILILLVLLLTWNATSDLITHRAKLASKRDGVGGIQVADQYYFAGGLEMHDLIPTNITEIYNITSGEFEDPIYLEEPRGYISTAVIGENIYFIGGMQDAVSCAMLYNLDLHQYEDIGCGPTVRQAIQVSNHNSTVTVLGAFSADFYDAAKGWYNLPKLTSWMQSMSLGARIIHENLIIGIGGVNTTTLEPIYDAWIYDTNTDNLTVFSNVTAIDIRSTSFGFTTAHNRIVIYFENRFFAHEFGTTEWHEDFMTNIVDAVILSDVFLLFNQSGFDLYSWSLMESQLWSPDPVRNVYAFENQVVMDLGASLLVYEARQLIGIQLAASIDIAIRWGANYVFHTEDKPLRLYDPLTKKVSGLNPSLKGVSSLIAFNDTTLVLITNFGAYIYDGTTDRVSNAIPVAVEMGFVIGTDIVSFMRSTVWINLGQTAPLSFTVSSTQIDNMVMFGPRQTDYPYIDVFNYATKQWQPRVPMTNVTYNIYLNFAPVAVIDDMIVVGKRPQTFRYNTTSGQTSMERVISGVWPVSTTVNVVPVTNHVGHLPGASSSAIVTVNSTTVVVRDDLQLTSSATHYVGGSDNVLYIASISGAMYYNLNTYDLATGLLDTLVLPTPQATLSLAFSNDTLVASGNDGNIYGLLQSDRLTWYQTPLHTDIARPIAVAVDANTVMLAGGKDVNLKVYTDELLFINASAIIELGTKITIKQPVSISEPSASTLPDNPSQQIGLSQGELATAIVVPVVVVIGGLIALIIVLVKRRRTNKNKTVSNTVGLESRYGDWFTPFDQITFGEQLGQGGSGQVFKGKWKNTSVALKVSMTQANNSVITELELMMQLRPHPNVVQLFGFSVHPETNSIILIIEFCEGGSLDTKLYDNSDEISLQTQVQWLTGIAKGLSHLHSSNIVHRDVAARNVLLNRNEPKLTDFGMSRLVDDQKQHGTTKSELGPIRWMSPESLKNKEYSTKSDIWSFGILMFEVVARQEPHSEEDPIEVGRLIRDEGLTPVIPSLCHPQLSEIMKQCWQMSPQSRPKIESVIELLEEALAKM